jgi:hypothetical protein
VFRTRWLLTADISGDRGQRSRVPCLKAADDRFPLSRGRARTAVQEGGSKLMQAKRHSNLSSRCRPDCGPLPERFQFRKVLQRDEVAGYSAVACDRHRIPMDRLLNLGEVSCKYCGGYGTHSKSLFRGGLQLGGTLIVSPGWKCVFQAWQRARIGFANLVSA